MAQNTGSSVTPGAPNGVRMDISELRSEVIAISVLLSCHILLDLKSCMADQLKAPYYFSRYNTL